MYIITVDDNDLYVPGTNEYPVSSAVININTDSVAYLDLSIPMTNLSYDKIAINSSIKVYDNNVLRFKMFVEQIDKDFDNNLSISCTSVMSYLNDSLVRPYSTIESEEGLTAPSSVNGYFEWLIEQHNKNIKDSSKSFTIGVNQGSSLDHNNYIYRSSTEFPTTADEIQNKIIDTYGAYMTIDFDGDKNILNLYSDVHESNDQIIDFGENLLDLTKSLDSSEMYTAVRPSGAVPDNENGSSTLPIDISSVPDGAVRWDSDIYKKGDIIYSISKVKDFGYKECEYSNQDITTVDYLLQSAVSYLKRITSPYLTISVKAVDLALIYMDNYKPLNVNQAVRVRSIPHGVDEYLRISSVSLDLLDPSQDEYTLGESYSTLTGQQSSYMSKLNSSINKNFDIVGSAADAANKLSEAAKAEAEEAKKKAVESEQSANEATAKAEEAQNTANEANSKIDEVTEKIDESISASKDAADKAAEASKKADEATAKTEVIEKSLIEISGNTDQAIANAKKAQDAADVAKQAADDAQASADANSTEVGKVKSQVENINTEIADVKGDATKLRDDLSGQIATVKNTMEAEYSRKSELTETTETLRNEISESAAGVLRTVSTDYATKQELKTTTDAANKNAQDLTTAIKKFDGDINSLQGQIDGSIQTWFYEVVPTNQNEPAVNWATTDLKNVHLGDLYYDTITGYCYRYQVQNNIYSWQRITDVDVTKALADAAKAQDTADHKRRVFVATPTTPYDVGDLWVQGTSGDIMRCQVAKTSGQSYAAADWVKASKYTDDTATNTLSNYVEKTYSTKSEVKQLSDTVSSTVSSLETVRTNAEAAQTSANNAKATADAAQKAADTAKTNASTAQATADAAKKNLETAQKNLETLQNQANVTDADLATAKANVEKAQKAANDAQTAADTAKTNASTAQATADAAKTAASNAQKDVDSLKDRVTKAETSIAQNADAITLRATKTEVTNAVNNISVGGRNYVKAKTGSTSANGITVDYIGNEFHIYGTNTKHDTNWGIGTWLSKNGIYVPNETYVLSTSVPLPYGLYLGNNTINASSNVQISSTGYLNGPNRYVIFTVPDNSNGYAHGFFGVLGTLKDPVDITFKIKLERGNKPTDWSPAPEDLESDATTKANDALTSAKSYTDAQIKVSADSISSTVSKTYQTKSDMSNYATSSKMSSVEQTVEGLTTTISTVKSTADSAKTSTNTLETLIRQSGDGVEVAKKVNGKYTSTKTLMGDDGFYVKDKDGTNLTQIKGSKAVIGKENDSHLDLESSSMRFMNNTTPLMSMSDSFINMRNGQFIFNTLNQDSIVYSNLESSGNLNIQSNRSMPWSDRCIIQATKDAAAGTNYNVLRLLSNISKYDTLGSASIEIRSSASSTGTGDNGSGFGEIRIYADDITLNNNHINSVISSGKSGDWYYRKWSDGTAEAMRWKAHNVTSWAWWNSDSYIKYGEPSIATLALPFKFITIYCLICSSTNRLDNTYETFVVGMHLNAEHTSVVGGYVCSPSGNVTHTGPVDIQYYISGTWK